MTKAWIPAACLIGLAIGMPAAWKYSSSQSSSTLQKPRETASPLRVKYHGHPTARHIREDQLFAKSELMPSDGGAARFGGNNHGGGAGTRGGGNAFVNDPCLDPAPTAPFPLNFFDTVQSETEIAVLNEVDDDDDDRGDRDDDDRFGRDSDGSGRRDDDDHDDDDDDNDRDGSGTLMVAGYNDSRGFSDNRQGLSGFSYSTDGGRQWIDAGGLPPRVPGGAPAGTLGQDAYFGDPVVVVHHRTKTFYYASLYQTPTGGATLSVNRGRFRVAPQQVPVESFANTRCETNPALHGVPDPPAAVRKRIIWDPPVEAVVPVFGPNPDRTDDDDFIDKEWLYVNQETGVLYLTYTRFGADGSTPIELVRSFDGGQTWTPPSIIVPNLADTFNQATMPIVTPSGRVIVTWFARTFELVPPLFPEVEQRIEIAYSDNCNTPAPCTFSAPIVVDRVNPQGEPLGYNRGRLTILNTPYITVDKGRDDGRITHGERRQRGFGNVYVTYFDGRTTLPQPPPPPTPPCNPQTACNPFARQADILLARSTTNGLSWHAPVKVNDDPGDTSHVFPSVQVNKHHEVFVTWIDRRVDRARNLLNDTWGAISFTSGATFAPDGRVTTVSTDWISREDAQPDYGDYNSSEVIDFQHFASIWADGRFPPPQPLPPSPPFTRPANRAATPDSIFAIIRRGGSRSDWDRD
jgi:hypothetical protein